MSKACRLSPPARYRKLGATRREHYAYPECWKYPIHDAEHTRAAVSYFARFGHLIPQPQRRQVAARIEAARAKHGIGPYHEGTLSMTESQKKARGKMMAANNAKKRGDMAAYKQLHAEACKLDPSCGSKGKSKAPGKKASARSAPKAHKTAKKGGKGKARRYRNNPEGTIEHIADLRSSYEHALSVGDAATADQIKMQLDAESEKLKEQVADLRDKEKEAKADLKEAKAEQKEAEARAKADPTPENKAEAAEKKAEVKEKQAEAAEVKADADAASAAAKGKRGKTTRKKSMKSTKTQRMHWMLFRQAVKNGDEAKKAEHKAALEKLGFTVTAQKATKGDIEFHAGGKGKAKAKKAPAKKASKKAEPKAKAAKKAAPKAKAKGKSAKKAKHDKKYPKLPKGYRKTGEGTYTKGKKGKTQIRVYKENPMGDVGAMVTIGIGGLVGAILGDLGHRWMATMGREGRPDPAKPLANLEASLAISQTPGAKSIGVQVGLVAVTGWLGWYLAKKGKRAPALFVGGMAIGAFVNLGLSLWKHKAAPAIWGPTAKDATEPSYGDRFFWDYQPDQVAAIDALLVANDKALGGTTATTDSKKSGKTNGLGAPAPALGTGASTPSVFTTAGAPASAHLGGLPAPGGSNKTDGCSGGSKGKACCDSCAHGGPCTGCSNAYTNPALPPPGWQTPPGGGGGGASPPVFTTPPPGGNDTVVMPPQGRPSIPQPTPPRGDAVNPGPASPGGSYRPFTVAPPVFQTPAFRPGAGRMLAGPRTLGSVPSSAPAKKTVGASLGL